MKRSIFVLAMLLVCTDAAAQRHVEMPSSGRPNTVVLTPKDITDFTAAAPKLKALGAASKADPNHRMTKEEIAAATGEAMSILKQHDFTQERFRNVSYSIALALTGLDEAKSEDQLATARAEQEKRLAEMKARLSPQQYEETKRQFDAAMGTMMEIHNQPPENLRLVDENREALEAVLKPK